MERAASLRASALDYLLEPDPVAKTAGVAAIARAFDTGELTLEPAEVFCPAGTIPGRPDTPALVPPRLVGRR